MFKTVFFINNMQVKLARGERFVECLWLICEVTAKDDLKDARRRPPPPLPSPQSCSSPPIRRRRRLFYRSPYFKSLRRRPARISSPSLVEMLGSQVQMLLAALGLSLLMACVSGAPQRNPLTRTKQLQLLKSEDPTCLLLLKFVLELVALRREEMLQELEEEELGGRQRLMRRRHIRFTQRERKAGCRNFFWKTFTSC